MAYHENYDSPDEILHDDRLSREVKIKMLISWRDDKHAYLRASEEGMQGKVRSELLQEIEEALRSLQNNPSG